MRVALHQAHLRSPNWKCGHDGSGGQGNEELFVYLDSLVLPPTPLGKDDSVFHWNFSLSRQDCERFPYTTDPGEGKRRVKTISNLTQMYRFRCIKMPADSAAKSVSEPNWALAESIWPSVVYVRVNGVEMEMRRKIHNTKDLPLDITDNLKQGENVVSLYFLRGRGETTNVLYAAGVEELKVVNFDEAKSMAVTLPAAECRNRIQSRLHGGGTDGDSGNDGEDLAIVSQDITINLCDPFMSKIFNVPARGRLCKHAECFDLDTFISTKAVRSSKNSLKERWKCPICGGDARPNTLIVDGFLAEVRAELEMTGQLDESRAIEFNAEGTWKVKRTPDDRPGLDRGKDNNDNKSGLTDKLMGRHASVNTRAVMSNKRSAAAMETHSDNAINRVTRVKMEDDLPMDASNIQPSYDQNHQIMYPEVIELE